jgi:hypothetical protein
MRRWCILRGSWCCGLCRSWEEVSMKCVQEVLVEAVIVYLTRGVELLVPMRMPSWRYYGRFPDVECLCLS